MPTSFPSAPRPEPAESAEPRGPRRAPGAGKIIFAALAALALGLLGVAFAIPREVRVQRTVRVQASPETVFGLVEDLRRHDLWMPWSALRPRPQVVFGRETRGVGATYFWIGDHRTHGTLTLESAEAPREIVASANLASVGAARLAFRFAPRDGGETSDVTLEFHKDLGRNPLRRFLRASHRRAGEKLLEDALARLKGAAEALPKPSLAPDTADAVPVF